MLLHAASHTAQPRNSALQAPFCHRGTITHALRGLDLLSFRLRGQLHSGRPKCGPPLDYCCSACTKTKAYRITHAHPALLAPQEELLNTATTDALANDRRGNPSNLAAQLHNVRCIDAYVANPGVLCQRTGETDTRSHPRRLLTARGRLTFRRCHQPCCQPGSFRSHASKGRSRIFVIARTPASSTYISTG